MVRYKYTDRRTCMRFSPFRVAYRDVTDDLKLSPGGADELAYYLVNGGRMHLEPVVVLGERRLDHFDLLFQHVQASHCEHRQLVARITTF